MIIEQSQNPVLSSVLPVHQAKLLTQSLESGKVLYFPNLNFHLENTVLLGSKACLDKKRKSMTYYIKDGSMKGIDSKNAHIMTFKNMMQSYTAFAENLITHLCPHYSSDIITGRTSFRPMEVKGRKTSYRKDDTRLHVDAFPSMPMDKNRILRVFSNVNPHQQDRIWKLGEPFEKVVSQFFPKLRAPWWNEFNILNALHITKQKRSLYDHYMLQLHNQMKYDVDYQAKAQQQTVPFAAGSTWVVYSDVTSHAALEGAYLLEQTFYLPFTKMQEPDLAPQSILEKFI